MKVHGVPYRTIWLDPGNPAVVRAINQQALPFRFEIIELSRPEDFVTAIREMYVRGAGLIGATAAYGMYISALTAPPDRFESFVAGAAERLIGTRPTARNLEWAVRRQLRAMEAGRTTEEKISIARETALAVASEDEESCRRIGLHGLSIIERILERKGGGTVNVLTHCNAGWLAFVEYGTALAPVYAAFERGIDIHVWVDATGPRNQGARLTAWELAMQGVSHHLVPDNAGGHLMQHGMVDLVIVGADRVTRTGDAANKIGTYLKALAAHDNGVPFYVAFPSSTFDWEVTDGLRGIPIEERGQDEVRFASGVPEPGPEAAAGGQPGREISVRLCPNETPAANYGFDVTPARLVTGLITERGVCAAEEREILRLYPERRGAERAAGGEKP